MRRIFLSNFHKIFDHIFDTILKFQFQALADSQGKPKPTKAPKPTKPACPALPIACSETACFEGMSFNSDKCTNSHKKKCKQFGWTPADGCPKPCDDPEPTTCEECEDLSEGCVRKFAKICKKLKKPGKKNALTKWG